MITSVKSCLLYDLLHAILRPSKFVYFNEKLHCCHGCQDGCSHDVASRRKCYVKCGHNIIDDMTLSTQ